MNTLGRTGLDMACIGEEVSRVVVEQQRWTLGLRQSRGEPGPEPGSGPEIRRRVGAACRLRPAPTCPAARNRPDCTSSSGPQI